VNEALLRLDLVAQLVVKSRQIADQPPSPAQGDCYLLPAFPAGAEWSVATSGSVAAYLDGVWLFITPARGWRAYVEDEDMEAVHDGAGWVARVAGTARNMLINAGFQVNQRGFTGGVLSAGAYGHDRWKAGPAGCEMSATGETVSLFSGSILQIVEAPGLAGQDVTVSLEDPDADVTVTLAASGGGSGSVSGVIPAGAGRQGVTLSVPGTVVADLEVSLSGAASWARPQLESGPVAHRFDRRPAVEEQLLCQRYFHANFIGGATNSDADFSAGGVASTIVQFCPPMRAAPVITFTDLAGTPDRFSDLYGGTNGMVITGGDIGLSASTDGFVVDFAASGAGMNRWRIRYAADADL
jgi:hypothetical protein